jgi:hypothetical protein
MFDVLKKCHEGSTFFGGALVIVEKILYAIWFPSNFLGSLMYGYESEKYLKCLNL